MKHISAADDHKIRYRKIWLAVFFYVLSVALFVQLIFLPLIVPTWHGGDGLLAGGDWVGYHRIALDLSDRINSEGWSAWELRPREQAPAGIAAVIYSLTGIRKPWILLPLNAALHATAALILLLLIKRLTGKIKPAIWAIIPFVFFPSALLWITMIHKDGFFILGSLMVILGFIKFLAITDQRSRSLAAGSLLYLAGIFLVWVVRPYGHEMLLYISFFLAVPGTIFILSHFKKDRYVLLNMVALWACLFLMLPLTNTGVHHQYVETSAQIKADNTFVNILGNEVEASSIDNQKCFDNNFQIWSYSGFLPEGFENILYTLAVMRDRYRTLKPAAFSNIDTNVQFTSAADVILYIPRALQIGFFAPFPIYCFEVGRSDSTTLMRRVAIIEMLIIYVSLAFSAFSLWFWRKKPEIYVIYGFSIGMILTYSLVIANIGTLYRMRYGFLMTVVACGVAALSIIVNRIQNEKKLQAK